jgi:hypothetical protein
MIGSADGDGPTTVVLLGYFKSRTDLCFLNIVQLSCAALLSLSERGVECQPYASGNHNVMGARRYFSRDGCRVVRDCTVQLFNPFTFAFGTHTVSLSCPTGVSILLAIVEFVWLMSLLMSTPHSCSRARLGKRYLIILIPGRQCKHRCLGFYANFMFRVSALYVAALLSVTA